MKSNVLFCSFLSLPGNYFIQFWLILHWLVWKIEAHGHEHVCVCYTYIGIFLSLSHKRQHTINAVLQTTLFTYQHIQEITPYQDIPIFLIPFHTAWYSIVCLFNKIPTEGHLGYFSFSLLQIVYPQGQLGGSVG